MTVTYVIQDGKILLAEKIKEGLGTGKVLGIGGKIEAGESAVMGAIREIKEEVFIDIADRDLQSMGTITYYFPAKQRYFEIHLFCASEYQGEPTRSDEMDPHRFGIDEIPYDRMWSDVSLYLPYIIDGQAIDAEVMYDDAGEQVKEYRIRLI